MSVSSTTFIAARDLPTAKSWAAAIRSHGFALELPINIDIAQHTGWLPCRYAGEPAGFELSVQRAAEYLEEQHVAADDPRQSVCRDDALALSFVTHSAMRDLVCAEIAGAVLARLAHGKVWSDEAGELMTAAEALEVAHARAGVVTVPDGDAAAPAAPEASSVATTLATRVVFRGERTLLLASLEDKPRRFTVRCTADPTGKDVEIVALWEHAVGAATVHKLRVGDELYELDAKGEPMGTG
jgi:hypothetical protein